MSISNWLELEILDHVFNNAAAPAITGVFVKLHLSDPGEDCTTGAALNTTRQSASFGNATSAGVSNDVAITWTSVPNAETYSHLSLWDASTAGDPLWSGALTTPKAVGVGDTFTIAIGDLDITLD